MIKTDNCFGRPTRSGTSHSETTSLSLAFITVQRTTTDQEVVNSLPTFGSSSSNRETSKSVNTWSSYTEICSTDMLSSGVPSSPTLSTQTISSEELTRTPEMLATSNMLLSEPSPSTLLTGSASIGGSASSPPTSQTPTNAMSSTPSRVHTSTSRSLPVFSTSGLESSVTSQSSSITLVTTWEILHC